MATTVIKSIKPAGGGDYTTLNAWEAAERANLITADKIHVAEVYGGGNSLTTQLPIRSVNGWVTDATRYIEIRAATGQGHSGVYDENKAYGKISGSCVWTQNLKVNIIDMQFHSQDNTNGFDPGVLGQLNNGTLLVNKCILVVSGTGPMTGIHYQDHAGFQSVDATITNNIIIMVTTNANSIGIHMYIAGTCKAYNNTIICAITGATHVGIKNSIGASMTVTSQNNYIRAFDCHSAFVNAGDHDATQNNDAPTVSLRGIAYTTANFLDVTAGAENLHLSPASVIKAAGVDLSSEGVVQDIDGQDRLAPYSIGADQPAKSAGGFFTFLSNLW